MTFAEQQTDFANKAQDSSNTYFPLAFVKSLLNQAYQDLARDTGGLKRFVQFVPDATAIPDVGAGTAAPYNYRGLYVPQGGYLMSEVREMLLDGTLELERCTVREAFARLSDFNNTSDATPLLFIPHEVKPGTIFLAPQPTVALTNLWGAITYQHPTLVGDGEVCEYPLEFHDLPVHRALQLAYGADSGDTQDFQKAAFWGGLYQDGKRAYLAKVVRNFSGAVTRQRGGFH